MSKSARERYNLALECVSKYGMDSPTLQTEYARIMSLFNNVSVLPSQNVTPQQPAAPMPNQAPPLVNGQPMSQDALGQGGLPTEGSPESMV